MQDLRSFRPWKLKNDPMLPEVTIHELLLTERKSDDRSQFVRFARVAATWNQWVEAGYLVRDEETTQPEIGNWQFAVCPLSRIRATQTTLPAHKEERQRLLEGTQIYFDPICVQEIGNEYIVIGNHDVHAAAVGFQEDMARPGKIRASDFALIAINSEPSLSPNTLVYRVNRDLQEIMRDLQAIGFETSNPDSAGKMFQVFLPDFALASNIELDHAFWQSLKSVLGLRTLDLNLISGSEAPKLQSNEVAIRLPAPSHNPSIYMAQSPQDSFSLANVPQTGAIMWSLRDF
jgi:hypothetical protein